MKLLLSFYLRSIKWCFNFVELEDQTVVEVDTPPFAGDGWRLRLENIARGGKDNYLQLKVQTKSGLRIDGFECFIN